MTRFFSAAIAITLAVACAQPGSSSTARRDTAGSPFQGTRAVAIAAGAAHTERAQIHPLTPMTDDVEILLGHPDSVGQPFVMRIRELAGTVVPPHTHPVDEHMTVVAGTWYFGTGDRFDRAALRALPTGAYAFAPAGTTMFAYSPEPAIVQIHGVGPFHIHWRDGLLRSDEPGADSTFTFRQGDQIVGPWGTAHIVMGYASGTLVQYEIEGPTGQHYMAHQRDLRRPQSDPLPKQPKR